MDQMDRFAAVKSLLGGLTAAIARISREMDVKGA